MWRLSHCTDVVHKGGNLVCLTSRGIPLVSLPDNRLLYYTLNDACINAIRIMNIKDPANSRSGGAGATS